MRRVVVAVLLVAAGACSPERPPAAPSVTGAHPAPVGTGGTPIRVLMVTATAGFRHDSIVTARQVMSSLAISGGDLRVTNTEDLSAIGSATLAEYDVLFFALTSGELPLGAAQKAALLEFVDSGGGFIGVHSAADTFYDWPDYGRLVGAYFKEHPWTQEATVLVEDHSHPATSSLAERFSLLEEFYTFRDNPRPHVQVLLRLDASSVGASGDYPLAWAHAYGNGRAYYNALGHFSTTWNGGQFQQQLRGAIRWAARR